MESLEPTFPPPPESSIDWSKLTLEVNDMVHGHIESRYSAATGQWSEPIFVADPYLKIHGLAPALNYGMQAYEGMKAYRSPSDSILLFRPWFHAKRMQHSCSVVSIPPLPEELFVKSTKLSVSLNASFVPPYSSGSALYIRPVIFGSGPSFALNAPSEFLFCVYVQPFTSYHGLHPLDALILEDFDRAAPNGTGNAKVGGNYAPVIVHQNRAKAKGYPITLHLDSKTGSEVEEFSTSGFIAAKVDGEGSITLVIPDSKNIINSVTSESVADIAREMKWKVEIRTIHYDELKEFSEVMAAGTAAALLPIKSLTYESKGETFHLGANTKGAGPVCQALYARLQKIQRGEVENKFGWCEVVGAAKDI